MQYINCCPYGGNCDNGLVELSKVTLVRNTATRELYVVAEKGIAAGEPLGQYLGEIEHVNVFNANRPRNESYRVIVP